MSLLSYCVTTASVLMIQIATYAAGVFGARPSNSLESPDFSADRIQVRGSGFNGRAADAEGCGIWFADCRTHNRSRDSQE
jgi:hypothetical protein